jgi:ABC-type lipoprotein export system ATPase subunit
MKQEYQIVPGKEELLLNAQNLYCIYKGKEGSSNVVALRGINLEMKQGEFISVVGPSGSGKSSLLRILGGLQIPSAGNIIYFGNDITKISEEHLVPFRRSTVGYIFQEGNLLPTISAFQNVVQTLRFAGKTRREARRKASELLSLLGVKSRMHDIPAKLSGGERQRVAIARAMANDPRIILADEPTGNVDYANAEIIMGLFKDLHKEFNTGFLIVTHSKQISSYSDRSIELKDGRFIGQHTGEYDITKLGESREVIISEDGTLILPPEMVPLIETYGNLWDLNVHFTGAIPNISARPISQEIASEPTQGLCPVCKAEIVGAPFFCKSCGAKLA